jgi:hypothetical protein
MSAMRIKHPTAIVAPQDPALENRTRMLAWTRLTVCALGGGAAQKRPHNAVGWEQKQSGAGKRPRSRETEIDRTSCMFGAEGLRLIQERNYNMRHAGRQALSRSGWPFPNRRRAGSAVGLRIPRWVKMVNISRRPRCKESASRGTNYSSHAPAMQ